MNVPRNITPIFLPSRARELNSVENIWQFLRGNWLSNLVSETYDDIIDAACDARQEPHRTARIHHIHRNMEIRG
jgi:hypothetical protein